MANNEELESSSEQVFDFSSENFTREDLITALHDMVNEYQKLSISLEETKAKLIDLPSQTTDLDWNQSNEKFDLEVELTMLRVENEIKQTENQKLKDENLKLNDLIKVWNKASVSLTEMQGLQKSVGDRTGLGFNNQEASASGTKPTVGLKGKYIQFVKSMMAQETTESVPKIVTPVNHENNGRKFGIGFVPESSNIKHDWKPRVTSRVGNNSMKGRPYQYYNSKPVQKRDRWNNNGIRNRHHVLNTHRAHNTQSYAQPIWTKINGRSVRLIQIWVPKGLIPSGPK